MSADRNTIEEIDRAAVDYAQFWFNKERTIVAEINGSDPGLQLAALQRAARYFKVARNFPEEFDVGRGRERLAPALRVVEAIREEQVQEATLSAVVQSLAHRLGADYGGKFLLSAATKFLWLLHRDVVIIYDSQARAALGTPDGNYAVFLETWLSGYSQLSQIIGTACDALTVGRLSMGPGGSVSERDVRVVASLEWFRRRVYDIYLWERGSRELAVEHIAPSGPVPDGLFEEGGPHNIQRIGPDKYRMTVTLPADAHGMVERECPTSECSPGYFKVRSGTGLSGQRTAYCPYCRREAEPEDFATKAQRDYVPRVGEGEAVAAFDKLLRRVLDIGPSNSKRLADGLIKMDLRYTPPSPPPIIPPTGEELRRDVTCPRCALDHAVYGLAVWCPDCGTDIFVTHVEQEIAVTKKMLTAIPERLLALGARVAARDLENALEDVVSIFEGSLKALTRRHLAALGMDGASVDAAMTKTVKNKYQSTTLGASAYHELTGQDLFSSLDAARLASLTATFEKRHPITHNLGVVDRKYLARAKSGELEGRDVRLEPSDVEQAADAVLAVVAAAHAQLFPE